MTHLQGWAVNKYDDSTIVQNNENIWKYWCNQSIIANQLMIRVEPLDPLIERQTHRHCLWEDWPKVPNQHALPAGRPLTAQSVCDAAEILLSWFHNIPYKTCNCRCHDQRGMLFCALLWHAVSTAIPLQSPFLVLVKVVRPEAASTAGWERRSPRRNLHLDTFNELITAALTIWGLFRDLWLSVSIQLLMISKDWSKPQQKHRKTVDTYASII